MPLIWDIQNAGEDVRSKEARRKSLQRAREAMPKKSSQYVTKAMELIHQVSPRKAARLSRMTTSPGTTNQVMVFKNIVMNTVGLELAQPTNSKLKKKLASSLGAELKKHELQRQASKKFNVSR